MSFLCYLYTKTPSPLFSTRSVSLPLLYSTVLTSPFRFSMVSHLFVVRSRILLKSLPHISFTQAHFVPSNWKHNHLLYFYLSTLILFNLGPDLVSSQKNPSKTIIPSGRPQGNATHRVYSIVSPEITLWVAAKLRCLQPGNEWRSVGVTCNIYLFSLASYYNNDSIHACGIPDLTS
jgi:hypothetical protein